MSNGVDRRAQIDIETVKGLLLVNGGGAVALLSVFSALVGREGLEPLLSAVLWAVFGMMFGSVCAIFHNHFGSARYTTNSTRCRRREAAFWACHFPNPVCVSSARCFYGRPLSASRRPAVTLPTPGSPTWSSCREGVRARPRHRPRLRPRKIRKQRRRSRDADRVPSHRHAIASQERKYTHRLSERVNRSPRTIA